jgi:hypothetical protein
MKPWLDKYPNGDLEALLNLEDEYRIDSLVCCLEQRIDSKSNPIDEETLILSICAFDREVNNGGFDQYLQNSSREFAHRLASDLKRIGLQDASDKVCEVFSSIGLSNEPSLESIATLVDSDDWFEEPQRTQVRDKLELFDDYFYDSICDCSEPLWDWLKIHSDEIKI